MEGVAVVGTLKQNQLAVMLNQALLPVGPFWHGLFPSPSLPNAKLPCWSHVTFLLLVAELDKNIMCLVNFHQEISMVSFTAHQSAGSLRWQTASVGASCGGGDGRLCSMDVGSGFVSACI